MHACHEELRRQWRSGIWSLNGKNDAEAREREVLMRTRVGRIRRSRIMRVKVYGRMVVVILVVGGGGCIAK